MTKIGITQRGGGDEHWGYKEKKHKLTKRSSMCYFLVLAHAPLHISEHFKLIFGEQKNRMKKKREGNELGSFDSDFQSSAT